ncbi:MAG: hypothetical protein WC682_04055 [Parcubacteria group bacterium]|jgi:hypothetical protein
MCRELDLNKLYYFGLTLDSSDKSALIDRVVLIIPKRDDGASGYWCAFFRRGQYSLGYSDGCEGEIYPIENIEEHLVGAGVDISEIRGKLNFLE